MQRKEILAKVAAGEITPEEADRLFAELEESVLTCKVSPKGAVSIYGLQRMPVTLYADQWFKLLGFAEQIRRFIQDHRDELRWRERTSGDEPAEAAQMEQAATPAETAAEPLNP